MPEPVLFLILSVVLLVVPIIVTGYAWIRFTRWIDGRIKHRPRPPESPPAARRETGVYDHQRNILKRCGNCGEFSLTLPFRDDLGRTYCSVVCRDYASARQPGFCHACLFDTDNEKVISTRTDQTGMGWTFGRVQSECPSCHSKLRKLWYRVLMLPVAPKGTHRTIQTSPYDHLARRLRSANA